MTPSARSRCCRIGATLRPVVALGMEEGQVLVQERRVLRGQEVLGQGQQRPEDDVAVGIAGPDIALALEEHEPLGPVAVGVLAA